MTRPATAVFVHGGWHDGWSWHLVRELLDARGVPYMAFDQYLRLVQELQDNSERGVFTIYNGPNWALADSAVEDRVVVAENSPARPAATVNSARMAEDEPPALVRTDIAAPFDRAFRVLDGAKGAFHSAEDGPQELAVETANEPC